MTSSETKVYPLTLSSHGGKALVMSQRKEKHDGQDHEREYCELGGDDNAIRVKIDSSGFIYNADKPEQTQTLDCFEGSYKEGAELFFLHNHDYDNQKFDINVDGTVAPLMNPEVVLGWDAASLKVKLVKNIIFKGFHVTVVCKK